MRSPAPLYDHTDAALSAMILQCGCKFAPRAHLFTCHLSRGRHTQADAPPALWQENDPHTRVGY